MKMLLPLAALTAFAAPAFAVHVNDAKFNESTGKIDISVSYGGGCKQHKFKLNIGACLESFPVQCGATLVDLTKDDFCEAYLHQTVSISLKEAGLNDSYFTGATLSIRGEFQDGKGAVVRLPR